MPLTASTMMELGTEVPPFSLKDVRSGKMVECPGPATGRPLLVMFICRHCPFVKHVQAEIARISGDYAGVVDMIAVSSNDAANYPADSPERLREMAAELGFQFPLCHDDTQEVAKKFNAACTPEFYLFDKERRLAYRGQLDGSRPGNNMAVDGRDLRAAMDAVLADRRPTDHQVPGTGCNIKWKPGNEPVYFESALVRK
jgi:peroxiredoxin